MIEIKNRWSSVTDREKWAARGASFVAKAKATKVVWFPPEPVEAGKKAASTAKTAARKTTGSAKKATGSATKKTTAAARKPTRTATKKPTGAAKKTVNGTKGATSTGRRQKA